MLKSGTLVKVAYISSVALMLAMPLAPVLADLPTITQPVTGSGLDLSSIEGIIRAVAKFLIIVSLVVAVVFIIIGAIYWMASFGDEKKIAKGKSIIWRAILGAAIVLAIGLILNTLAKLVTLQFFNY